MQNGTPLQRLAGQTLKQDPGEWVRKLRSADLTWQQIADQLGDRLGFEVSRETVRLWSLPAAEAPTEATA